MLPFEFFVEGPPVSQQTRRRSRLRSWKAEVKRLAAHFWPAGASPAATAIMVTLTYLYDNDDIDLDNVAKPVLDAMKGIIFLDDEQVTDLVLRKRNLLHDLRIGNPSPGLAAGFARGSQFVHVLVDEAPDQGRLE